MVRLAVVGIVGLAGCLGLPARPVPDGGGLDAAADAAHDGSGTAPGFLFGDQTVEGGDDGHGPGLAEASSFKVTSNATVSGLVIHYGGGGATKLYAALYADDGSGEIGNQLATSNLDGPFTDNTWVTFPVTAQVTAGNVYWIAALCPVGGGGGITVQYRYIGASGEGACNSQVDPCTKHSQSSLTSLPISWVTSATYLPSVNSYYATGN